MFLILDFFVNSAYIFKFSAFPFETIEQIVRFGGATFLYLKSKRINFRIPQSPLLELILIFFSLC